MKIQQLLNKNCKDLWLEDSGTYENIYHIWIKSTWCFQKYIMRKLVVKRQMCMSEWITLKSRTSGTHLYWLVNRPWRQCCALWSPPPRSWQTGPPLISPCSGWTEWGWQRASSAGSTCQFSGPAEKRKWGFRCCFLALRISWFLKHAFPQSWLTNFQP